MSIRRRRPINKGGWAGGIKHFRRELIPSHRAVWRNVWKAITGDEDITMSQGQIKYAQLRMATGVLPEIAIITVTDTTYERGWLAQRYHMWRCNSIMIVYKWDIVTASNGHENNKIYQKGYYIDRRPDYGELKTEDEAIKRGLKFHPMRPFKTIAIKFRPLYSRPALCIQDPIKLGLDGHDEDHVDDCEEDDLGTKEPAHYHMDRAEGNADPPQPEIRTEVGTWNIWRHMPQYSKKPEFVKKYQYIIGPHLLFVGFEATDHLECRIFADISVKGRSTDIELPPGIEEPEEAQMVDSTEEKVLGE